MTAYIIEAMVEFSAVKRVEEECPKVKRDMKEASVGVKIMYQLA